MNRRIGMGAANLNQAFPSGLNRYTGELVRAMLAEGSDLTVYAAAGEVAASAGGAVRPISPRLTRSTDFSGNLARLLWHQWELPRLLKADLIDVFYSPVPEGMFFPVCPQVVTIHDLIPLRFPDSNPRLRHYYRWILPRILRACAGVVAVSEATRGDMESQWRLKDVPVHVIYQGYRDAVFRPATESDIHGVKQRFRLEDFVVAVADTRAHKNLDRIIAAFAELRIPRLQLAVVGKGDQVTLRRWVEESGSADRIRVLGSISDGDLASLYSGARGLIFPSLWEGFGIPPLEAMACGCPVVTARVSSLPEVCGDAAIYVDPHATSAIAEGITRVTTDASIRSTLRDRGLARAAGFTYAATARRTLELLESIEITRRFRRTTGRAA